MNTLKIRRKKRTEVINVPVQNLADVDLYYEIRGEGYPLLMIMGLGATIDWWHPRFIEQLEKNFKLIIFDNRDAGRSGKAKNSYQIKDFASDSNGLLAKLEIKKSHVLGISMGGMIAQELAIQYPERVNKLVLVSTSPGSSKSIFPSQEVISTLSKDRKDVPVEKLIDDFISLLYTDEFLQDNADSMQDIKQRMMKHLIDPIAYQRQLTAILNHNALSRLENLKIPTLVLHGKQDILMPPGNAELIADAIPNTKLKYYKGAGHALLSHEPLSTGKEVVSFLQLEKT